MRRSRASCCGFIAAGADMESIGSLGALKGPALGPVLDFSTRGSSSSRSSLNEGRARGLVLMHASIRSMAF